MLVENLVIKYGYLMVLIGSMIEGEFIILLASKYSADGLLNIYIVFIMVLLGSVITDQLFFILGYKYGRNIIERFFSIRMKNFADKIIRIAKDHETLYSLSFRFILGIRTISPLVLGMTNMSKRKFTILNIIAGLVWSAITCISGYKIGKNFTGYNFIIVCILFIIFSLIIKKMLKRTLYDKK